MLVRSNLAFPGQPFGASHRPWRLVHPQLAAVAFQWHGADLLGYVACYLRLDRHAARQLDPSTVEFGFTGVLIEHEDEQPDLLDRLGLEAARCRTHATILAGHQLGADLDQLVSRYRSDQRQLADLALLARAWTDRPDHPHDLAQLHDTHDDPLDPRSLADLADDHLIEVHLHQPVLPPGLIPEAAAEALLAGTLRLALTIGLIAGRALRRLDWHQPIPVDQLIDRTAWDLFSHLTLRPTAADA